VVPCGRRCDCCLRRKRADGGGGGGGGGEEMVDLTEYARLLLGAVRQTGQRYGLGVPVDVLRGSMNRQIVEKMGGLARLQVCTPALIGPVACPPAPAPPLLPRSGSRHRHVTLPRRLMIPGS
jgi:hypothetical protein